MGLPKGEPYLLRLSCDTYRYIVKLRCSNHKLAIETGRYSGIDRNLRYCDLCALDILGEKHSQGIPSLGHTKYGHGGRERGHLGVSVGSPKGEKHSQGNLSLPVVPSMHMEVG